MLSDLVDRWIFVDCKDIVMLSLVASASTLVLEVLGACSQADLLKSPVSMTLQLVTGVTLPLEQFDAICRPESRAGYGYGHESYLYIVIDYDWYSEHPSSAHPQAAAAKA